MHVLGVLSSILNVILEESHFLKAVSFFQIYIYFFKIKFGMVLGE